MGIKTYLKNNYGRVDKSIEEMALETQYTEGSIKTIACRLGLKRNSIYEALPDEQWLHLKEVGLSKYEVSNYGRIRNYNTRALMKSQEHHQSGYLQISLVGDNGVSKSYQVHRLVVTAFTGGNRTALGSGSYQWESTR